MFACVESYVTSTGILKLLGQNFCFCYIKKVSKGPQAHRVVHCSVRSWGCWNNCENEQIASYMESETWRLWYICFNFTLDVGS